MIPADLPLEFVRVVERAAIEAARTMGQGDRKGSDHVAVEAMRREMETVDIDGTIVIGEGERDEAPMLYIGEKVGTRQRAPRSTSPSTRSRGRTSAPPARRARSRCWPRPSGAGCSTHPTSTWRSWWCPGRRAASSTSTRRSRTT